jgi:hypothetical protein
MFKQTEALYADLAKALGLSGLAADANGGVQLEVGDSASIVLFAEDEFTLLVVSPVTALPAEVDYGRVMWMLRRNHYDSPIAPFRIACDRAGSIVLWGRLPVEGLTGEQLATFIDSLAAEAELIRGEVEVDEAAAAA